MTGYLPHTSIPDVPLRSFLKSHFAPAFCILPADRRRALQVVYAFFRVVDDAIDDAQVADPGAYVAAWRTALRERRADAAAPWGQAPLAATLLDVIARYGVPWQALDDFLDQGVASDLAVGTRFETAMDTERYCYGVAGTVGLACLPIFGVPVEEGRDFAIRLGVAVQWTNILRDVGDDARLGRLYLPLDHLERFDVRPEDLLACRRPPRFDELMRFEAGVARSHYRRAWELLPPSRRRELRPALIMGRIYEDLLGKIERRGFPVFTKRVSLNIVEKMLSTWRAFRE